MIEKPIQTLAAGAQIVAFDPEAMDNVKSKIGDVIDYKSREMDALDEADPHRASSPDLNDGMACRIGHSARLTSTTWRIA